jgi:predicted acetyltransferase
MTISIRAPRPDEAEQSRRLSQEAFGMPDTQPTTPASLDDPGMHYVAAFDGPTMAGRMIDREYDSWFGGRLVPTSGIGGVAVTMEYRQRGLLRPMFAELFAGAVDRGAVISTLHPSAPGIYRGLGYEVVATLENVRLPMAALSRVAAPPTVTTRRATVADAPGIRAVYDHWAQAHNGPLDRRGVSFATSDEELIKAFTGITIAEQDGEVVGYASWDRRSFRESELAVSELLATDRAGYRALLASLATYSSVIETLVLDSCGLDLIRAVLPSADWQPSRVESYMLKIIDVRGALSQRGYPNSLDLELDFGVRGDTITGTDGRYRLSLDHGTATCLRLGDLDQESDPVPVFTPNGLALAYAGAQSCSGIRMVGGLTGPAADDETWGAVFGGRPFRILDHF